MKAEPHYGDEVRDFDGEPVLWLAIPVRYRRKSGYHVPEGTCCYTGFIIFHVAKMVREKGIPYVVFDDKKWFIASDVDQWVQEAKKKRIVEGPRWGRKSIPRVGGVWPKVRRRASASGG